MKHLFHPLHVLLLAALMPWPAGADVIDLNVTAGDTRVAGDDGNGFLGFSVASGDVNGDGYDDMILGAESASPGGRSAAGKVYVVYGSPGGLAASIDLSAGAADVVIEGGLASGRLGRRVASGDVNGDGFDDILMGAPFADPPGLVDAGVAYVVYGGPSLAATVDLSTTSADVTMTGAPGEQLGFGLAAGDIDGDGVEDLVVSATKATVAGRAGAGRVHVLLGGSLASTYDLGADVADWIFLGSATNDDLGNDLALGDLDGDGYQDLAIAAYRADPNGKDSAGEVYVFRGRTGPSGIVDLATAAADVVIQGAATADLAGKAIAFGDMNYDTLQDLAIGAYAADPAGRASAGAVYVVDARTLSAAVGSTGIVDLADSTLSLLTLWGAAAGNGLGSALEIFDSNGDGMADLLVSEPFTSTQGTFTGAVHLITGDTQLPGRIDLGTTPADHTILGDDGGDHTGFDVTGGDFDGDGIVDLLIGAPGAAGANPGAGEVILLLNAPPHVEMSTPDTTAVHGSSMLVPVRVDSTTGLKMVAAHLDLLFDGGVITYAGLDTTASLLSGWSLSAAVIPGAGGGLDTLRLAGTTTGPPATTAGTFLQLDFAVIDTRQPASSPLSIDSLLFNGGRAAWNLLTSGSLTVVGYDGSLATTVISTPGDTVRVRVIDRDGNLDAAAVDTLVTVATNARTGEIETLRLVEQSPDDSVFFSTLSTLAGAGSGTNDDGVMQVQDADTLKVTFVDSLDAAGTRTDHSAGHLVIDPLGDADGNGALQAFDASRILAHAAGLLTLAGRDSLAANVDSLAPVGPINAFDAVLVIQRRLGLLSRFPVQADNALNHPQPETDGATPKALPRMIALHWQVEGSDLVLYAAARDQILAADLRIEGLEHITGMRPAAALFEAQVAYQRQPDGSLQVALAVPQPAAGPGELLRLQLRPGASLPSWPGLTVDGRINDGRLMVRQVTTGVPDRTLPQTLRLYPNHPNPFNAATTIRFDLPRAEWVQLEIYNSVGQHLRTLLSEPRMAGSHQMVWDGTADTGQVVASGTYVYVLRAGGLRFARRLVLLK